MDLIDLTQDFEDSDSDCDNLPLPILSENKEDNLNETRCVLFLL